jgi:hypothetical protein
MGEPRTIVVKCTYLIPVEFPADWTDEMIRFEVEQNGCPGTGFTGAAFDAHLKSKGEESICWACTLQGENKIISGLGATQN